MPDRVGFASTRDMPFRYVPPRNRSPVDLAEAVCAELRRRKAHCPKLEVLRQLFECMYFASLKTEESEPTRVHIVYLDPRDPDPKPPERIVKDRWSFVRLARPIRMTASNLTKIATASDPRSSAFAVYPDGRDRLTIWGLIDQGNRYHDFVNYESESGPDRPGLFQASITGIGHLVTSVGYEKIAELRINRLVRAEKDVLRAGPVSKRLEPGILKCLNRIERRLPRYLASDFPDWREGLRDVWIASLCRLLLRIQNYRHGGALLITPDSSFLGLNLKHSLRYDRLRTSLVDQAILGITATHASDTIFEKYLDQDAGEIPVDLYFDETIAGGDREDTRSELEGTIWFISLLSRVDGLVLMNPDLAVRGFGVEITYAEEPPAVFVAGDRRATKEGLRRVSYDRYGTRHRSMMRYCYKTPGSVGFVISQDGDVRVMTRVHGRLVIWENIKLRLDDFVRRRRRRRKISEPE